MMKAKKEGGAEEKKSRRSEVEREINIHVYMFVSMLVYNIVGTHAQMCVGVRS